MDETKDAKRIAVIGAGFIGVEVADEYNKVGKEVTLIELQDDILNAAFDSSLHRKQKKSLSAEVLMLQQV